MGHIYVIFYIVHLHWLKKFSWLFSFQMLGNNMFFFSSEGFLQLLYKRVGKIYILYVLIFNVLWNSDIINLLFLAFYCEHNFYLLLLYPVFEILTFWNYLLCHGHELVTYSYAEFYFCEFETIFSSGLKRVPYVRVRILIRCCVSVVYNSDFFEESGVKNEGREK
jgi:hypothetical protein